MSTKNANPYKSALTAARSELTKVQKQLQEAQQAVKECSQKIPALQQTIKSLEAMTGDVPKANLASPVKVMAPASIPPEKAKALEEIVKEDKDWS